MGFTLIELLIVISLLGALAVGMLATLDPLEQIRKGNDSGVRNTVSEFQNAAIRYYAIKEKFPWEGSAIASMGLNDSATMATYLTELINSGELKADFTTLATTQLSRIFINATTIAGVNSLTTCYKPNSKAFQKDPNTIYDKDGVRVATTLTGNDKCKSDTIGTGGKDCYWCVR